MAVLGSPVKAAYLLPNGRVISGGPAVPCQRGDPLDGLVIEDDRKHGVHYQTGVQYVIFRWRSPTKRAAAGLFVIDDRLNLDIHYQTGGLGLLSYLTPCRGSLFFRDGHDKSYG
jgi:hypothetical protein